MEYKIVGGRSSPNVGDRVKIRVLRDSDGTVVVDRPYKDRPLRINAVKGDVEIPSMSGTYEIKGVIERRMLATAEDEPDYFFISDLQVDLIYENLVELPQEEFSLSQDEISSEHADVDVDVNAIFSDDTIVEKSKQQSSHQKTISGNLDQIESYNDLLLGKQ